MPWRSARTMPPSNARVSDAVPRPLQRPGFLLLLLAATGVLLSVYIGRQEAIQYSAIERLRVAESVDTHFAAVQDHLAVRQTLAKVVAALFDPPPLSSPHPLGDFGNQVLALVPDVQTVGWLPEVAAADAPDALKAIQDTGVALPRFVGADKQPLSLESLGRPIYPIVDVVPIKNRWILGVDAGSFPERLAAIRSARDAHEVVRTVPLHLVQSPEANALLLYAPVYQNGKFRGVLGFGYEIRQLFSNALKAPRAASGFDIRVYSDDSETPLVELAANGEFVAPRPLVADGHGTSIERKADFAGRDLRFVYTSQRDLAAEGLWQGLSFAAITLAITGAVVSFFGFLTNRATALAGEVRSRRSAEERLKMLIHELNHRVRNVLSVAQAVVRLSFTAGYSLNEVQKTCEGRLQALANAMSLLTASDWKSVNFRHLITPEILPFAERISAEGPDLALKPRSAQTFALLLYELSTNAAKHGAFSVPAGKVFLRWQVDHSGPVPVFRLSWREVEGPKVAAPTRRGFGELLVRRIAPRDVAGKATISYEADGFEYGLEAPLAEVLYTPQSPENRDFSKA